MQYMTNTQVIPMIDVKERAYYTVPEAAKALDVSASTVWRWIEAGQLPAYRVGKRRIRIKKDDLMAMIQPARGQEGTIKERERIVGPITPEELDRRQALVTHILKKRKQRVITPLTTNDLIHQVREGRETMTQRQFNQSPSLQVGSDQPLIGIITEQDGQETVQYFTDEESADAATSQDDIHAALSVIGAWSDLDWDEMERELDRIRHESKPTPPITEL